MSKGIKIFLALSVVFLSICFYLSLDNSSTSNANTTHKVTILENNGVSIKKEVSNAVEGYDTLLYNGSPYFSLTKQEFIDELNRRASEKGYSADAAIISVSELFGGIDEIQFKMKPETEADAKLNGDFLYILIDMFSPGMQEIVSNELGFFMDIPDDKYFAADLICGNTTYGSYVDKWATLTIKPSEPPEPPKVPSAIKPK